MDNHRNGGFKRQWPQIAAVFVVAAILTAGCANLRMETLFERGVPPRIEEQIRLMQIEIDELEQRVKQLEERYEPETRSPWPTCG